MYAKCYFFPITEYLDTEKPLTKEEHALYKGFLSLVMNLTKHVLCIAFHHLRDQTLPEGCGRTNPASCKKATHPHLCCMVLRLARHWGSVLAGGKDMAYLLVLRKASSMPQTTVMVSELPPTGKCTDIMLCVSHTTKNCCWDLCISVILRSSKFKAGQEAYLKVEGPLSRI